jgi:hypothetical protein
VGQLKAIEPSEGMRDVFSKTVQDARVTAAEGSFDNTGVEDGWADLVVIAQVRFQHSTTNSMKLITAYTQAFHWCPNYDSASAEFARILKPKGIVAFIWNLEDRQV